ncbi:MAG: hypothetical protein ACYCPA_01380 [Acidithiobacillus sp.]
MKKEYQGYPCRESGQSLVETVIAGVFVLVPLFLLVPLLGKYIDLQNSTLQAARNAAFERTVWSASGQRNDTVVAQEADSALEKRVVARFFGPLDQGVQSTGNHSYSPRALWSGTAGHALLPAYQDMQVSLQQGASPDEADAVLKPVLLAETLYSQGGPYQALNFNGLFTANVTASPRAISYPFLQALQLQFRAHDTLLADGWGASNPADMKTQVQASLPRFLGIFRDLMKPFQLGEVEDLNGLQLEKVVTNSPTEVPKDHLKAYSG